MKRIKGGKWTELCVTGKSSTPFSPSMGTCCNLGIEQVTGTCTSDLALLQFALCCEALFIVLMEWQNKTYVILFPKGNYKPKWSTSEVQESSPKLSLVVLSVSSWPSWVHKRFVSSRFLWCNKIGFILIASWISHRVVQCGRADFSVIYNVNSTWKRSIKIH